MTFANEGHLRVVTLTRTKALNALNKEMVDLMRPKLEVRSLCNPPRSTDRPFLVFRNGKQAIAQNLSCLKATDVPSAPAAT